MPEGDTVFRTATKLREALEGKELTRCDVRVPRYAAVDLAGQVHVGDGEPAGVVDIHEPEPRHLVVVREPDPVLYALPGLHGDDDLRHALGL